MNGRTASYSLALMVLCLLIAAALRFPELQITPPGLHYDEAANGILAGDIEAALRLLEDLRAKILA